MKAVVQRVLRASVSVDGQVVGTTVANKPGLLVFVGVASDDSGEDADALANKIAVLRVFANAEGKFDLALADVGGSALVISQFTLLGDCRRGRRPDMTAAAPPDVACPLYERFAATLASASGCAVATGRFGAHMIIDSLNDGPVTLLLDSRRGF